MLTLSLSTEPYPIKLEKKEVYKIHFGAMLYQTSEAFELAVSRGYAFTSTFRRKKVRSTARTIANFKSCNYFVYDIDGMNKEGEVLWDKSLEDTIPLLRIKPSFAYESLSNCEDGKGYRFRLIYYLDDVVKNRKQYIAMSKIFGRMAGVPENYDSRSNLPEQFWYGTYGNAYLFKSDTLVNIEDVKAHEDYKATLKDVKKNYHHYGTDSNKAEKADVIFDKATKRDFYSLSFSDFLDKYDGAYRNITESLNYLNCPEDTAGYRWTEDDYALNERKTYEKGKGPVIIKFVNGERRKQKLYYRGVIRRHITHDLTPDELLYGLVFDFYHYFDNSKDKITKEDIVCIVADAYNANLSSKELKKVGLCMIQKKKKDGKKVEVRRYVKANPAYCEKYGVSKSSAAARERQILKGEMNDAFIDKYYDHDYSLGTNLQMMLKKGLKVTRGQLVHYINTMKSKKATTPPSTPPTTCEVESEIITNKNESEVTEKVVVTEVLKENIQNTKPSSSEIGVVIIGGKVIEPIWEWQKKVMIYRKCGNPPPNSVGKCVFRYDGIGFQ